MPDPMPVSAAAPPADRWLRGPRLALLIALVAVAWFATIGYRDLADPDEGRYSEISREMVATGDWVTPRLDGLKYFEKPPLQYWATAVSFTLLGPSDFAARAYTGLAGLLSVLAVAFCAGRLWGRRAGVTTGGVALGMFGIVALANVVTLDMGVAFWLTLSLCGFLLALRAGDPDSRRRWMLVVWAAMAGAVLSKGLIGVVIPGTVLLLHVLSTRNWRLLAQLEWLRGLPLFLLIAAPWFVLVSMRNPEFAHFFFVHEHFERFLTTEHHREGAPWYFVPILLGGLLPWLSLAPAAVRDGWRDPSGRVLVLWCSFVFVFFSISKSKLPGYLSPIFPAMAMLIGRSLAAETLRLARHATGLMAGALMVGIAAAIVLPQLGDARTPPEVFRAATPFAVLAMALLAGAAWLARRLEGCGQHLASVIVLGAGALSMSDALDAGYQDFAALRCDRQAAALIEATVPGAPVFAVDYYNQTLPFYLRRTVTLVRFSGEFELGQRAEPERWIPDFATFAARWAQLPAAAAVTRPETWDKHLQRLGLSARVLYRDGRRVVLVKP
ncbi:MAG TPA: phospholipid carrier-dependent glycosyltransferase [Candidatus Binatia bacterium]|nr:phospholipid carrier-dependent glycosyltransferase [Candidatus Binatia bacterium]